MTDQSEQISITATFNGKEMTAGASARTNLILPVPMLVVSMVYAELARFLLTV
jgi:hypothetical protein